jgi:hypothetical protein
MVVGTYFGTQKYSFYAIIVFTLCFSVFIKGGMVVLFYRCYSNGFVFDSVDCYLWSIFFLLWTRFSVAVAIENYFGF